MNGCKLYPGHDACQFKMNITFSRSRIVDWWSYVALIVNQWPNDKMVTSMLFSDSDLCGWEFRLLVGQNGFATSTIVSWSLLYMTILQYAAYSIFTIVLRWMFQELDMATMFKLMFHVKTRTLTLSCNHTVTSSRILLFWKMRYCTSTLAC